jgi:hypothetical protein
MITKSKGIVTSCQGLIPVQLLSFEVCDAQSHVSFLQAHSIPKFGTPLCTVYTNFK